MQPDPSFERQSPTGFNAPVTQAHPHGWPPVHIRLPGGFEQLASHTHPLHGSSGAIILGVDDPPHFSQPLPPDFEQYAERCAPMSPLDKFSTGG